MSAKELTRAAVLVALASLALLVWVDIYAPILAQIASLLFAVGLFIASTMFSVFVFFVTASGKFIAKYASTTHYLVFRKRLIGCLILNVVLAVFAGIINVAESLLEVLVLEVSFVLLVVLSTIAVFSAGGVMWIFFCIAEGESQAKKPKRRGVLSSSHDSKADDNAARL